MNDFLADYRAGRQEGRYVDAALPALPFDDLAFDLALCSHLLFLYTTQLGWRVSSVGDSGNVPRRSGSPHLSLLTLEAVRSPLVGRL